MTEYNAKEDGEGSYLVAIAAKKARGDDYYLLPHKDSRLFRSIPEGITRFVGRDLPLNSLSQGNSRSLASFAVDGPFVGHQDFCGSLQGVHIQGASSIDDTDSGAKPGALYHGAYPREPQ